MIATRRFLRDRTRSLRWWLIGSAFMVLSSTAVYPTLKGNIEFDELVAELPEAMTAVLGMDTAIGLSSAPGYLQARLFSTLLPLVLLIFAVELGTRSLAGAEEAGIIELTLAQPITRRRLASERFLAVVALAVALTVFIGILVVGSAAAFGALEGVSIAGLVAACAAAGALALLHAAIAFNVGAATGRRAVALGVATSVAVAGFVVNGLTAVNEALAPLRFFSPWHWYLGRNMLVEGPAPDALIVPLLASAVLFAAGVWRFERRDLR